MKINIRKLGEDGLSLKKTLNASELGLPSDIIDSHSPIEIDARIERADDAGHYGYKGTLT